MSPRTALPLLFAVGLAACTQALEFPTATIEIVGDGENLPGEPFVLDGSSSSDPNELPAGLIYAWRLLGAPAGSLAEFNAVDLPLVALVPDAYGEYVVGLQVSNGVAWSEEATATMSVTACGNEAPAIDSLSADPASPLTGDVVQLSATWTEPDLDDCGLAQAVAWDWSIDALPAGSQAELNDASASNPSFFADLPGDYGVSLVLTDDTGRASDAGTLVVTVSECGSAVPSVTDVTVTPSDPDVDEQVTLAITVDDADNGGSCSLAQDLDVTSAFVDVPAASHATLAPSAGSSPTFVPDVPGDYVVRTTVTDGTGRSSYTDTTVAVGSCGTAAPTVDSIAVAGTLSVDNLISLDVAWTDDDNDAGGCDLDQAVEVHTWFVSRPAGSTAALAPSVGETPAFVADVSGPYLLRTQVTDDTGRSAREDTLISVDTCGEAAPTIALDTGNSTPDDDAGTTDANTGDFVSVTWTVADADNGGCALDQTLSVATSLVAAPAGSAAALDPAAGTTVGFTPDIDGDYVLRATVDDGTGRTATTEVVVTVGACGGAFPTIALDTADSDVDDDAATTDAETGDFVEVTWSVADTDNDDDGDPGTVDPDGCALGQTLSVETVLVEAPAGSTASVVPAAGTTVGFTPDVPGIYVLRATVDDGTGRASTTEVVASIDPGCGDADPTIVLNTTDSDVDLDSGTTDANAGELVTVAWTVADADDGCGPAQTLTVTTAIVDAPAGSTATLAPSAGTLVGFTPDLDGDYTLRATVDDGTGRSGTVEVVATIDACGNNAPTAQVEMVTPFATAPSTDLSVVIEDGVVAQLSAQASSDPDQACGQDLVLGYTWWFTAKPAGSTASLNDATLVNPSFTPDVPGVYDLLLAVDDGRYEAYATIEIEMDPSLLIHVTSGFDIEFVAGGSGLWDNPEGLAVDPSTGDIYVAQNGGDRVTRTTSSGASTSTFSLGGWIQNPHDIAYDTVSTDFFVTTDAGGTTFDRVVRLSSGGQQTAWTTANEVDEPRGIAIDPAADPEIAVADAAGGSDELRFYDADEALGTSQGTNDFNGQLNGPWGVAISGTSRWAANADNGEVWRWTVAGDEEMLDDGFIELRDLARAPSGDIVVADEALQAVYLIEDCGTPPCTTTLVAWGPWTPFGLTFDAAGDLLVTDNGGDLLYRISGPF